MTKRFGWMPKPSTALAILAVPLLLSNWSCSGTTEQPSTSTTPSRTASAAPTSGDQTRTKKHVATQVIQIASEVMAVHEERIKPETRLVEDLRADGLTVALFIMELEQKFHVTFTDSQAEQIHVIGDAIEFVEAHGKTR